MPRSPRRVRIGFTLVELLVVIGIIALLISILLPALSQAQRQGRAIKCMSSLRQLGIAYNMYANENKGWWPAAVHNAATGTPIPIKDPEIRWPDMLQRYISQNAQVGYNELTKLRKNSVIWGCPEWAKAIDALDTNLTDNLRPGYGMNVYPLGDYKQPCTLSSSAGDYSNKGRYFKQTEWTKPSDRALLADSVTHVVIVLNEASAKADITSTRKWYPVGPGESLPTDAFYIDGNRHGPVAATRAKQYSNRFINQLFCDGHVSPVSVKEAWNAIWYPGEARGE